MSGLDLIYVFGIFFVLFFSGMDCLKDVKIMVPQAVKIGETITLRCDYDLESVALYTIKWYRNEEEFYRFLPKESPPTKVFIVPFINVDVSRSNSKEVTLTDVKRETSGVFKCEVSSDAPLFHTVMRLANLLVADVPLEDPVLRTDVSKITHGAKFNAKCTTPGSYPHMNVTWLINDQKVEEKSGIQIQSTIVHYDALPGLETVRSTIAVDSKDLFKNRKIKLKCLVTMFTLYNRMREIEIMEEIPQIAQIREQGIHSLQGYFSTGSSTLKFQHLTLLNLLVYHLWIRNIINH